MVTYGELLLATVQEEFIEALHGEFVFPVDVDVTTGAHRRKDDRSLVGIVLVKECCNPGFFFASITGLQLELF